MIRSTQLHRAKIRKSEYFLIEGNIEDTILLNQKIENFVKKYSDKDLAHFDSYSMRFFNASKEVTIENIKKDPKKTITSSVFFLERPYREYRWKNGKLKWVEYMGENTFR